MNIPDQLKLAGLVYDALDTVAPRLGDGGWEMTIGDAISERLHDTYPEVECLYGRRVADNRGQYAQESLFDFMAGLWEPNDRKRERYLKQALIVGECEAGINLGDDFDKLLVADSLVCFFAFQDWVNEHAEGDLDFFHRIAESRRQWVAQRGMHPPTFIIASYSGTDRRFTYRPARNRAVAVN